MRDLEKFSIMSAIARKAKAVKVTGRVQLLQRQLVMALQRQRLHPRQATTATRPP